MKIFIHYTNIGWIAVGGICGALLRHGTNTLFGIVTGEIHFFTATMIENLLGSFLMGVLYTILHQQPEKKPRLNLFLLTGLLGSYTTYSGFIAEAFLLFSDSFLLITSYIFTQLFAGIALLVCAIRMTETFSDKWRNE